MVLCKRRTSVEKYLELKINGCEDVQECLKRIEEVKQIILK